MCDPIRRLTPDELDRNEERAQAHYDRLYAEIEASEREEHDREFGRRFPFKPDGRRVHAKIQQRLQEEQVGL